MFSLRPYQETFVERSLTALREYGNTLGVAATGGGKSLMLSSVAGRWIGDSDAKACVIAHREEIHQQNAQKFLRVNPEINISQIDADIKSWQGQTTFAMAQTLSSRANLGQMPALDLLVIDEAHHAAAPTFCRIIDEAKKKNPDVAIYGLTASPQRGDKKGLRHVFNNVADHITVEQLIKLGYLVPPVTYVIDLGVKDELDKVEDNEDQERVAEILDHESINHVVVEKWKELAGNRKTIFFCTTVDHAEHVCEAFKKSGVNAAVVSDRLRKHQRRAILKEFDRGEIQVLLNCFVLTEGFDSQPVSCISILRKFSHHSTFTQMVGRGLRVVDPLEYPGVVKEDCIVIDFGTSVEEHKTLEQDIELSGVKATSEARKKSCLSCDAEIPYAAIECPLCGNSQIQEEPILEDEVEQLAIDLPNTKNKKLITDAKTIKFDLLAAEQFDWTDITGNHDAYIATGLQAWAGVFHFKAKWYAVGGRKKYVTRILHVGGRPDAFRESNEWMNKHEPHSTLKKQKRWVKQHATADQVKYLPVDRRNDYGMNRYTASCLMTFEFNKQSIENIVLREAGVYSGIRH